MYDSAQTTASKFFVYCSVYMLSVQQLVGDISKKVHHASRAWAGKNETMVFTFLSFTLTCILELQRY